MSKGRSILLDMLYKAKEDLTLGLLRSLHVGYPLLFLEILFLTEEKKVHEANLMAEALTGSSKVLDTGRHASRDADAFSRQNSTRKGPRKVANFNEAFQCRLTIDFFSCCCKYVSQKFAVLKLQLFLKLHAVSCSWTTTMLKSVGVEEKRKTSLLLS